ncbi:MAG: TIGR01906 family membrane protein [Anaerolineae bacterium]
MRRLAQFVIAVALPAFLLLTNVRLLMTSAFLHYEYGRAGFPAAAEFTAAQRMATAQTTLAYVRGHTELDALRQLPYREKEVRHLVDVRVLTGRAFATHWLTGGLLLLSLLFLARQTQTRPLAARSLVYGSGLTLALLGVMALIVYVNFDWFFVRFHRLFFEGDSWLFDFSDTLIQVFPIPFWFDAALGLALLTMGEALAVGLGSYVWLRRREERYTMQDA